MLRTCLGRRHVCDASVEAGRAIFWAELFLRSRSKARPWPVRGRPDGRSKPPRNASSTRRHTRRRRLLHLDVFRPARTSLPRRLPLASLPWRPTQARECAGQVLSSPTAAAAALLRSRRRVHRRARASSIVPPRGGRPWRSSSSTDVSRPRTTVSSKRCSRGGNKRTRRGWVVANHGQKTGAWTRPCEGRGMDKRTLCDAGDGLEP